MDDVAKRRGSNSSEMEPDSLFENIPGSDDDNEATLEGSGSSEDEEEESELEHVFHSDQEEVEDVEPKTDLPLDRSRSPLKPVTSTAKVTKATPIKSDPVHRMSQSMYVRSDSRESQASISFFVDLSSGNSTNSSASGERRSSLPNASTNMQVNEYFRKIKELTGLIGAPCLSREEVKRKVNLGKNLKRLLEEDLEKLQIGYGLTNINGLDALVLAQDRPKANPVVTKKDSNGNDKPVLRRERTFDLDPNAKIRDVKVVDISLDNDSSPISKLDRHQRKLCEVFQQQSQLHAEFIDQELSKLSDFDKDLAAKVMSSSGDRIHCWTDAEAVEVCDISSAEASLSEVTLTCPENSKPIPIPRPRSKVPVRPARRCDSFSLAMTQSCHENILPNTLVSNPDSCPSRMTLAEAAAERQEKKKRFKVNMINDSTELADTSNGVALAAVSSSACSWFIPTSSEESQDQDPKEKEEEVKADDANGGDLFKLFQKKKHHSNKHQPKAFFISCEDDQDEVLLEQQSRPKSSKVRTQVIDLAKNEPPSGSNLQEALRSKRPDYINKSRSRENQRLAQKYVSRDRSAILENIPTTSRAAKCAELREKTYYSAKTHKPETTTTPKAVRRDKKLEVLEDAPKRVVVKADKSSKVSSSISSSRQPSTIPKLKNSLLITAKKNYQSPYSQSVLKSTKKRTPEGSKTSTRS